MKFLLDRASDAEELGIIEINSLNELKQLNSKYNNKEYWSGSQKIVIDFKVTEEDKEQCIDGRITIYDNYIE